MTSESDFRAENPSLIRTYDISEDVYKTVTQADWDFLSFAASITGQGLKICSEVHALSREIIEGNNPREDMANIYDFISKMRRRPKG